MLYCSIGFFCGTSSLHQETEDLEDLEAIWTGEEYMGPQPRPTSGGSHQESCVHCLGVQFAIDISYIRML